MEVGVGDYIEGYEVIGFGIYTRIHKTRIIVNNILKGPDTIRYCGVADDSWRGSRGATINGSLGDLKKITDEKPFSHNWWENTQLVYDTMSREWDKGDIVKKCTGEVYKIVDFAINSETLEQFIVYTDLDNSKLYVEPREVFEELNKINNESLFKFEKVK